MIGAQWAGVTVLIAGGAGFIGSALARRLLALGANVRVIDSMLSESGAHPANLASAMDKIAFHEGDVREQPLLDCVTEGVDVVFSLVGLSGHRQSMLAPFADLDANTAAPLALLHACRRIAPKATLVYASSRQIYGRAKWLPITESHPTIPLDVNAIHTAAAEHYHRVYADTAGLDTRVLRLTHTIGPGMRIRDARQSFVGLWIRHLLQGRPFEVWGGEQKRDFSSVDDVVNALLAVARAEPDRRRVFNVSGETLSLRELADRLIALNGGGHYEVVPMPADQAAIDLGDSYSDASRLNTYAHLPPAQALDLTLEMTLAFYREHLNAYL